MPSSIEGSAPPEAIVPSDFANAIIAWRPSLDSIVALFSNGIKDFKSYIRAWLKVQHKHGERFIQACLDRGNSPATASKKISGLRRLFQLAVERGRLEENPFLRVRRPKVPRRKVHVNSDEQCGRLIKAAREPPLLRFAKQNGGGREGGVDWELLIILALCTGMRRGELLNTAWRDINQWLSAGLTEYDVMNLAGHADFETTRRFYLAVREDLLQRARIATAAAMNVSFGTHLARTPFAT